VVPIHPNCISFENTAHWYTFGKLWLRPEFKVGFADDGPQEMVASVTPLLMSRSVLRLVKHYIFQQFRKHFEINIKEWHMFNGASTEDQCIHCVWNMAGIDYNIGYVTSFLSFGYDSWPRE
jgi:hypothetical protein